jgi:hypothetical protein
MSLLEKCLSRIAKKKIKNEEPQMEFDKKPVLSASGRFSADKMHNVRPRQVTPEVE